MIIRIINIIVLILADSKSKIKRFLTWHYRLLSVQTGRNVMLTFPLRLEGKGKLSIGDYSSIKRGVKLSSSEGSEVILHNNVRILEGANIHAGENTSILLGDYSSILANSILRNGNEVEMKTGSCIASYCHIFPREEGYDGKFILGKGSNVGDHTVIDTCDDVIIKDYVAVGPNCIFYTHDHDYASGLVAAWKGKVKTGKIILEEGAWVGARVTILPGVVIGKKAVVAAGSVVTKNVEAGDIVGGIPAKSIKKVYSE